MRRVICLANSYKHQGRCIAGIAVDSGEWIRPISELDDGRIPTNDSRIPSEQINLLDIVDITLTKERGSGYERENRLYTNQNWNILGKAEVIQILRYREQQLLYPEFGRKVPSAYLSKIKPAQTLQLIEVKQILWEKYEYAESSKFKAFLLDEIYDCTEIGFSITDPITLSKLRQGQPVSSHCLLCMSFSQPFQGSNDPEPMCYRLVAGVIELLPEIEMIGQEMQRVGWTITEGRSYLQTQFSKESRYQLTDSEAQAVVQFLQTLPTAE
ncbi:hypothetical protein LQF76_02585 [Gloeomargaritales cyanobacterium VI4D9]|nr:hypothetical protein LQF76_02585 [Gloeomargaritales cyanobacterium VI4D9]